MSQESLSAEATTSAHIRFEYAWRYFALHSQQRVTMFHFFLLASGVMANAYGLLVGKEPYWQAGGVALIGLLVCAVSFMLDMRNHQLVRLGEKALRRVEQELLLTAKQSGASDNSPEYAIMSHESEIGEPPAWRKHKILFRSLEVAVGLAFLGAAVWSFCEWLT